ncbi:unnamed protein product [Didymodactylos carnosus]|uniref:Tetratricopeptide repeat protein n=1 Tax=Didymodactylos carnosus TaxID=1234261 RepID=A0A814VPX5_9BILA|nr:unnamed protein product [Didymodactylos carnosus]CAF1191743.1 unnamed protein product [Didymodactylos carnosus]CAF3845751.1 unnamed protein product [Didymodactylos carnosus]CAF3956052.1 unnamed protein product [Didymodactylos carnosus]
MNYLIGLKSEENDLIEPTSCSFKIYVHGTIARFYVEKQDYQLAIKHYEHALLTGEEEHENNIDDERQITIAKFHCNIGHCYEALEDYRNCLGHYKKSLEFNTLDSLLKANVYFTMASIYENNEQQYNLAIEYYRKSLIIESNDSNEDKNKELNLASLNNSIGWCYCMLNKQNIALEYCQKSIIIYETTNNIANADYLNVCGSLALIYYQINDYDAAWNYCIKSLSIKEILMNNDLCIIGWIYEILGNIYLYNNDKTLAFNCYKHSLDLFRKQDQSNATVNNIKRIKQLLNQFNNSNEPLRKKQKLC